MFGRNICKIGQQYTYMNTYYVYKYCSYLFVLKLVHRMIHCRFPKMKKNSSQCSFSVVFIPKDYSPEWIYFLSSRKADFTCNKFLSTSFWFFLVGQWNKNQRLWLCADNSVNHRGRQQFVPDHQSKPHNQVRKSGNQETGWYPALQRLPLLWWGKDLPEFQCIV